MKYIKLPQLSLLNQRVTRIQPKTGRSLSLRANFVWTFAGNLVYAACQWGMLVALAKLGSPEMVGQFALALAITAPVLMLTNLQTRGVQATDAKHEYTFGDYLGLRLITTTVALLVIAGITITMGYRRETALVVLIVGVAKAFESVSDVFYGFLQQREHMAQIAISMMLKGVLSLMLLGGAVYLTNDVLWGVVALAAAWGTMLVSYDIRCSNRVRNDAAPLPVSHGATHAPDVLRARWSRATMWKLTRLSLPLGITMLLMSLNTSVPRYFIEHYLGERELGIFAAMSYLIVAETTVVSAMGQTASPRLAQYHQRGDAQAFRMLTTKLLVLSLCVGGAGLAVALFAGRITLTLLYSAEYAAYTNVFGWLMAAAALVQVASVLGYAATARRKLRYQPVALLIALLVSGITCYLLIPDYGLWAAGLATVASSASMAGIYALILLGNDRS